MFKLYMMRPSFIFLFICVYCIFIYISGLSKPSTSEYDSNLIKKVKPAEFNPSIPNKSTTFRRTENLVNILAPEKEGKDVVIGLAVHIDFVYMEVFCTSLRRHTVADIVLFTVFPLPEEYDQLARSNRIIFIDVIHQREILIRGYSFVSRYHPSTLRWPFVYQYLLDNYQQNAYSRVLLTDVRDTVFQGDPFAVLPKGRSAFYAFEEGGKGGLEDCKWNSDWIVDCFGEEALQQVRKYQILCSGVSLASIDTALPYLKRMSDIVLGKAGVGYFPNCERNGVDQGIYNVLMYNGTVPHVRLIPDGNGVLVNMQNGATHFTSDYISTKDGKPVSIAHQYDRHALVKSMVIRKYNNRTVADSFLAPKVVNKSEPVVNTDPIMTGSCGKFVLSINVDVFSLGNCDLFASMKILDTVNDCCRHCLRTPQCKGFTYDNSQACFLYSCTKHFSSFDNWGGYSGLLL